MSEEVEFVIRRIDNEYGAGALPAGYGNAGADPPPLDVVDRAHDEYDAGDGPASWGDSGSTDRSRGGDLTDANIVSVAPGGESTSPIGTAYDLDVERTASVRIEAVHHSEWGYIDPHGEQGIPWPALVRVVRRAILRARTAPQTDTPDTSYTHLRLANQTDQSADYYDYYRADLDIVFDGFETLPAP